MYPRLAWLPVGWGDLLSPLLSLSQVVITKMLTIFALPYVFMCDNVVFVSIIILFRGREGANGGMSPPPPPPPRDPLPGSTPLHPLTIRPTVLFARTHTHFVVSFLYESSAPELRSKSSQPHCRKSSAERSSSWVSGCGLWRVASQPVGGFY